MTAEQWLTLVTSLGGTVTILARMRSYVSVEEYRLKVASLHATINEQAKDIAVHSEQMKRLESENALIKDLLKK